MKLQAEVEANAAAIKTAEGEVAALGKKLAPLEEKEELKTLDDDDRIRLAALRKTIEQVRDEKKHHYRTGSCAMTRGSCKRRSCCYCGVASVTATYQAVHTS